jgi:hypothetical protein
MLRLHDQNCLDVLPAVRCFDFRVIHIKLLHLLNCLFKKIVFLEFSGDSSLQAFSKGGRSGTLGIVSGTKNGKGVDNKLPNLANLKKRENDLGRRSERWKCRPRKKQIRNNKRRR